MNREMNSKRGAHRRLASTRLTLYKEMWSGSGSVFNIAKEEQVNFNDVAEDPKTIEMVGLILKDIGLEKRPDEYEGDDAFTVRNKAANALKEAIQRRHDADKKRIAAPDPELVQKAIGSAKAVEKDRTKVSLTQTVIEMIVIGHVWMAKGDRFAKFGALSRILDVMEQGMTAKRHRGFFDCDGCDDCQCDTGGCGSCGGGCGGHP